MEWVEAKEERMGRRRSMRDSRARIEGERGMVGVMGMGVEMDAAVIGLWCC